MPTPRPPLRRVPVGEGGFSRRVSGVDDVPTTPYGFALEPPDSEPDAVTAFYMTPEAIPLLPPRKDDSHIAPIASLSPAALSTPPVTISEPPPARSNELPWRQAVLVVGAAVTAFVVTAAVGRFTHARRTALPPSTEMRPATAPPAFPEPQAPSSAVTTPVVVADPVVIESPAPEKAASKSRHRATRAPARVRPAPVEKRPYMPTEL